MMIKSFEHKQNRTYEQIENNKIFIFISSSTKENHSDKSTKNENRVSRRRHITLGPSCKKNLPNHLFNYFFI
jgi:hypothetical protein